MQYTKFKNIFNETIFEESKAVLIEKIAKYPSRYIGLFRPTKPKAKILQNLLQSHEIRFGDAFEEIIEEYLKEFGYEILNKRFVNSDDDELNLDQCFKDKNAVYFIEQKIRDDHDSTKKRGQISNFEKKLNEMVDKYGEKNLVGIFYFIDPDLQKNKNYYKTELEKMARDYGVKIYLSYGVELFDFLQQGKIWSEILKYLEQWKKEIPDFPETNFDINAENSFEEIKNLSPALYRKLFQDDNIFNEIILTIFPEKKTLRLLLDYFKKKSSEKVIYATISKALEKRI
ncbi:restriction endonuclease [Candidatus Falkowbacteria bacterium CG10_big_fil_rev_8_21_14_0_10_37_18]|uniref:type II site-specific deoxyribonuclease n=1 Tax=Candidatus Falkowbacteria bacterium CG10_big_fil_rev_8_21_14_0_10_37_18 TaxID=1974562 RepID=A0A2H0VBM7_9BACT|nr:MAG: restriction endonuclease [Candidatus Falkowbacteria bacterium CG10_big_fil_rev_8_21_14_0_10_37_18]